MKVAVAHNFALKSSLSNWCSICWFPLEPTWPYTIFPIRLLDLYCGVGGAAHGYHQAGYTEIVGIDLVRQPHYPYTFIQGDVLDCPVDLASFDLIHASPPCQAYSRGSVGPRQEGKTYPDLVEATIALLEDYPHVIENVEGSPLRADLVLCGSMMNPRLSAWDPDWGKVVYLKRHRVFQSNFPLWQPPDLCHMTKGSIAGVYGGGGEARNLALARMSRRGGYTPRVDVRRELMGIPWATQREVNEAIPPAYTEFIGREILETLASRRTPDSPSPPSREQSQDGGSGRASDYDRPTEASIPTSG